MNACNQNMLNMYILLLISSKIKRTKPNLKQIKNPETFFKKLKTKTIIYCIQTDFFKTKCKIKNV